MVIIILFKWSMHGKKQGKNINKCKNVVCKKGKQKQME